MAQLELCFLRLDTRFINWDLNVPIDFQGPAVSLQVDIDLDQMVFLSDRGEREDQEIRR